MCSQYLNFSNTSMTSTFIVHNDTNGTTDFDFNRFKNVQAPAILKISGTISYLLQVGGSLILITFSVLEQKGIFGKYRSVINLLNSWIHGYFALFAVITDGIDLARLTLGPLPASLCNWNAVMKNTFLLSMIAMNVFIAFLKFMFICVWKSYRHMNHKLISMVIGTSSLLISFLLSLIQTFGPGRTTMFNNVCTATLYESERMLETKIQTPAGATFIGLALYSGFCIAIAIKRFQFKKKDIKDESSDFSSMMFNLAYLTVLASGGIAMSQWNKFSNDKEVDMGSVWMYPVYLYFVVPLVILGLAILRILVKYGKKIFKHGTDTVPRV